MTLEQLYTQYGKQMVDRQLLNQLITQTEQAINAELNKPKPVISGVASE